jgi:hypothetical protein
MRTTITFQSNVPPVDYVADSTLTDTSGVVRSDTGPTGESYGTKPKNTGDVVIEITVWTINNRTVYVPNLTGATFTGSDAAIDNMSTMDLLNLIAQVGIGQGFSEGYSTCPATCCGNVVKVAYPACISRVGRGLNTRFESCGGDGCCIRSYSLCCPDGGNAPYVRLMGSSGGTCSGTGASGSACESTCP